MHLRTKALLGLATIVAVMGLLSAPASATTLNTLTVSGGTINVALTPPLSQSLGGSGTGSCAGGPSSTIGINVTGSSSPRSTSVPASSFSLSTFTYSSASYVLDLSYVSSGAGSITGASSPYSVSQPMTFTGEIRTDPGSCAATGTLVCEFEINLTLTGSLTGSISGETIAAGASTNLGGSGTANTGICNAPFSTLGSVVTSVTGLNLTK